MGPREVGASVGRSLGMREEEEVVPLWAGARKTNRNGAVSADGCVGGRVCCRCIASGATHSVRGHHNAPTEWYRKNTSSNI